jgi:hypothetical protein
MFSFGYKNPGNSTAKIVTQHKPPSYPHNFIPIQYVPITLANPSHLLCYQMAFPQQHNVHFPGNPSYTADAPWNATGFLPPQPPQPASPYPRPLPGQLHGHAGVLRVSRLVTCLIHFRSMTHILASGLMTLTMTHHCTTTCDSS